MCLKAYLKDYNSRRLHQALDDRTPDEVNFWELDASHASERSAAETRPVISTCGSAETDIAKPYRIAT